MRRRWPRAGGCATAKGGTCVNAKRSTIVRLATLCAVAWVGPARPSGAQPQSRPVRIGLIAFGEAALRAHLEQALIEGLRQQGYVEGRNLVFERRYAEGRAER